MVGSSPRRPPTEARPWRGGRRGGGSTERGAAVGRRSGGLEEAFGGSRELRVAVPGSPATLGALVGEMKALLSEGGPKDSFMRGDGL